MKPQIGTIVVYHTTKEEREDMRTSHTNIQEHLPAMVVAVWGENCANLKVFLDGSNGDLWKTSVYHINENPNPIPIVDGVAKVNQEGFWEYIEGEEMYNKKEGIVRTPSSRESTNETEKIPSVDFPIPTLEEVREKIVKSLSNTNWITRYSAIRMIDYVILPTLGSEADVKFWEGISDILKQQEKS